jgi:hypothetical protein
VIHGPIGQNESNPFARVHWPSERCRSRAVTSLAHAYPNTAAPAAGPIDTAGAGRANHYCQLGLVLDLLGLRRQPDGVVRPDHRGRRLEEQQRLLGHLGAVLGGVLGVVAPDADHLAGQDRREQADVGHRPSLVRALDLGERMTVDGHDGLALDHAEGHAT